MAKETTPENQSQPRCCKCSEVITGRAYALTRPFVAFLYCLKCWLGEVDA